MKKQNLRKNITYGQVEDIIKILELKAGKINNLYVSEKIHNKPLEISDYLCNFFDERKIKKAKINKIIKIITEIIDVVTDLLSEISESDTEKKPFCSQSQKDTLLYDDLFELSLTLYDRFKINPIELRKQSAKEVFTLLSRCINKTTEKEGVYTVGNVTYVPASDDWF